MALKYYKNAKRYAQEIPLPGSRSLKLMPGYYVFGDFAAISSLSDEGVSEPAEVTATPSLLAFEEDVSLTNLPTVAAQDGKVLMTDGTDVIWGTPADITGGVDGAGTAEAVAYWTDANTLAALGGVVTSGGDLRSVALLGVNGTGTADLQIAAVPPDPAAGALVGFDVTIAASSAVDGTDTHLAANGGNIVLTPGTAVNGGTDGIVDIVGNLQVSGASDIGNVTCIDIKLEDPQAPPASASATGTAGQIVFGSDGYLYFCTAVDTWVRVQLATWA